MAPEVLLCRNHGFEVDYFALGIIAAECMTGRRPYKGATRAQLMDEV